MTKINLLINILFPLLVITFNVISQCSSTLSDKRLCYDPECSEPVSFGKTVLKYYPKERGLLRFDINIDVKVYSKEAGSRNDLWGVEINGERGYAPKKFIKEYRVLHKDLKYEVPVNKLPSNNDKDDSNDKKPLPKKENNVLQDEKKTDPFNGQIDISNLRSTQEEVPHTLTGITPPYEVIDGTTINLNHAIQPTVVANVAQATAVPNEQKVISANSDVSSDLNKIKEEQENSFAKDDEVQQKAKDEINIKSGSPQNNEIEVPSFGANASSQENVIEKSEVNAEIVDNAKESNVDIGQPLEKISDINSTKSESDPVEEVTTTDTKTVDPSANDLLKEATVSDTKGTEPLQSASAEKGTSTTDTESSVPNLVKDTTLTGTQDTEPIPAVTNTTDTKPSLPDPAQADASVDPKQAELASTQVKESTASDIKIAEPSVPDAVTPATTDDSKEVKLSESDSIKGTTTTETKDVIPDTNIENVQSVKSEKQAVDTDAIVAMVDNKQEEEAKRTENTSEPELKDAHTLGESGSHLQVEQTNNGRYVASFLQGLGLTNSEEVITPDANVPVEEKIVPESDVVREVFTYESIEKTVSETDAQNRTLPEPHLSNGVTTKEVTAAPDIATTVSSASNVDNLNLTENDTITNIVEKEVIDKNIELNTYEYGATEVPSIAKEVPTTNDGLENNTTLETVKINETDVNINVNSNEDLVYDSSSAQVPIESSDALQHFMEKSDVNVPEQVLHSSQESISNQMPNVREYLVLNRQLFNVQESGQSEIVSDNEDHAVDKILPEYGGDINEDKVLRDTSNEDDITRAEVLTSDSTLHEVQVSPPDVCSTDDECANKETAQQHRYTNDEEISQSEESFIPGGIKVDHNYWLTLIYLSVTAATTLVFSLGYYYIENLRRDGQLIAKINKLEKDLLVSTKECTMLNENLKATKDKLTCIEDESFGSNEMVLSLKADLEASQNIKTELEDQVAMLEKDLETATEAGLELERMLREVLSSNNEVNPLAQSVEDLQARLNAQQAANESLTNALSLKTQENEALSAELATLRKKYEELEVELTRVTDSLKVEIESRNTIEQTLSDKVQRLEMQIKEISTEKAALQKELRGKEAETKDLVDVINQLNSNTLDLEKLYDVSRIKAESTALLEERNLLKVRLAEVEGAHNLLEEHMKVVKEEIAALSEQCKVSEKEKKDAETRLEVLSNFFKEKEAQRQKEEAIWLQKQGEVVSTVERIQTMQNEIQNYKQQVEILKHEILDQEREYKGQISLLEMKAHEQWVVARQVERRLEESKAEAGQLRNRLTLIEKNINDVDSEQKLHRLEANGDASTSLPLFIGAESSSSPIMFTGSSGVPPPPPPSYLHSLFPPYLPPPLPSTSGVPPYEVGQRPPPLGGRLSSPPPMPLHPPAPSRYDNAGSPPPPMSPHMLPPFNHHRSPPPPPFGSDRIHPPPPPPGSILPPPLGTTHSWGEESLPLPRNSGFHPPQRERVRNHKGSLHSSGESLDKTHHSSKV